MSAFKFGKKPNYSAASAGAASSAAGAASSAAGAAYSVAGASAGASSF